MRGLPAKSGPRRPPRLEQVFHSAPLYFVTFCTDDRKHLLANEIVLAAFLDACSRVESAGNTVGCFMIMPDHIHIFIRIGPEGKLGQAVKCLRERITKRLRERDPALKVWQPEFFDHLLRSSESYSTKWDYVRHNPVRAGLINAPDEWPYQGEITVIRW